MSASRPPAGARAETLTAWVLLVLTVIPSAAGLSRLAGLSAGGPVTPENARFFSAPLPVILHVIGATLYCALGALQVLPRFRTRFPAWHRRAGRVLIPLGLVAALSGLWMTVAYPLPPGLQGPLLYAVLLVVGTVMALALVLGWVAQRRRDPRGHRTWMLVAMAMGQGAGMQVVVILPVTLAAGAPVGLAYDLLMTLAWLINLAAVAWLVRRPPPRPRTATPPS